MEEQRPLASIIVRTKDRPKLLRRALMSIAAQTYRPIEVVLVNDGGCDLDMNELQGTLGEIFLNYQRLGENAGRAHALNVGIGQAKGEHVCFLDDDDVYFPDGVETLVTAALRVRNNVLYGKVVCRKYADDDLLKVIEERVVGETFDAGRLVLENFIPINAVCVPINLLREIGLLDTGLPIFEDWDMMIRLSEAAVFQFVDVVVAEYSVIGSATITGKGGVETQNAYREKVLAKHIAKVKAHDILSYLQSIIDRVVLEKDRHIHDLAHFLNEKELLIKSLEESVAAKDERILWLHGIIRTKDEKSSLPDVDIIIVNYNGIGYIEACLDSLFRTEYPCFRVILVDNGSSDGSVELVQEKYPHVQIILNNANLGFGQANTIGIDSGKADFILLLNNDTMVDKNWLLPLVLAMLKDSSVASVCSKLLFMDNRRVINGVGGGMNFLGYGFDIGIYENDDGTYDEVREVFFPCAAACLLRRSAFEEVGGFDRKFFMYHEDVDLGWRFRLRGYRVKCIPGSVVYHALGGTSLKTGSTEFRNNLGLRHAMRSLIKNYEIGTLLKVLPIFMSLGIRTTIKKRTLGFLRCFLWNLLMLPDTLSERRRIQKGRTVTDRAISSLIWQKVHLPVNYPDYEVATLKAFAARGYKRSFVDMSDDRGGNLGYGWHSPEIYFGDGRTNYRWTKAEAVYYLWNKYGDGFVSMEILGLACVVKRPRKIRVTVNDGQAHEFIVQSDGWESIQVPYNGPRGPLEVRIKAEDTWCPDEILGNGDTRQLGVGMKRAQYVADTGDTLSIEGVSVVIPTYNRVKTLLQTLRALENQSIPKEKFEVIVVDDGSTDSTESEVKSFMDRTSLAIRYLKQANKKQGAARNLGIQHSQMPLLVFIGDDTIPSLHFIEEHLAYHTRKNRYGNAVVIGYTQWPEDIRVTPFMRFIGEYGYQFGYSLIEGEGPLPFNFFYTSNISILKAFLDELECIFEEDFTTYGWEDIELGYRLERNGMELFYNRNAVTYHYHPVDISSFCVRQRNVGRASRIFLDKHPELGWFLGDKCFLKKIAAFSFVTSSAGKALNFIDRKFLISFPRIVYDIILKTSYARGAIETKE